MGSFGRTWEKVTAMLVSVFVLLALIAIGVAVGIAIVYYWDDITHRCQLVQRDRLGRGWAGRGCGRAYATIGVFRAGLLA